MQFLFIDWLDLVIVWQPPGVPIRGVCSSCEESRLRTMGVLSLLPHELIHEFVADVGRQIGSRRKAEIDEREAERYVYSQVEAILPELAEIWEQHASPRLRGWLEAQLKELDSIVLTDLLPLINRHHEKRK